MLRRHLAIRTAATLALARILRFTAIVPGAATPFTLTRVFAFAGMFVALGGRSGGDRASHRSDVLA